MKGRIAFIDLETTSADPKTARVVQIGYVLTEDGKVLSRNEMLLNPCAPISPEATSLHGITDEMVKGEPTFEDMAAAFFEDLEGYDLAGFNLEKFDIPILVREFAECEIEFPKDRKIVDVMTIFHRNEKRNLSMAVRLYCGRSHDEAHGAGADASATFDVLKEQIDFYQLPEDAAGLESYCHEKPAHFVDQDGKLIWNDLGVAVFSFGKLKGESLQYAAIKERGFLEWMLRSDFSDELKGIIRDAMAGAVTVKPAPSVQMTI